MIKFFRQLRQNHLESGKTSKSASPAHPNGSSGRAGRYLKYAIGEIILVMIGILLALQVNNWNEQRKDTIKEQSILKSLRANLSDNLDLLDEANKSTIEGYNAAIQLQEAIQPIRTNIKPIQVDSLINVMIDFVSFDPVTGVINEIINSGQLILIKNETLKNEISNWSRMMEDTELDVAIANDYLFEEIIVYLTKNASISNIPIGINHLSNINQRPRPPSSFNVNYSSLMTSLEFENIVSFHASNLIYVLKEYNIFKSYLENVIALIDSEIK